MMNAEIRADFADVLSERGETVTRESSGKSFRATLTPCDVQRSAEIGGYVDKATFELLTLEENFTIGERLAFRGATHRVARIERGVLTRLYLVEI